MNLESFRYTLALSFVAFIICMLYMKKAQMTDAIIIAKHKRLFQIASIALYAPAMFYSDIVCYGIASVAGYYCCYYEGKPARHWALLFFCILLQICK